MTFLGRDDDLAAVTAALERHRVVTLTGGPGVGKTRLAMEAAGRTALAVVDLAAVADGPGVPRDVTHLTGRAGVVQQSMTVSGFLSFAQAPNPADVYGSAGQASTAYVQVLGGPKSGTESFYSNSVCGKP